MSQNKQTSTTSRSKQTRKQTPMDRFRGELDKITPSDEKKLTWGHSFGEFKSEEMRLNRSFLKKAIRRFMYRTHMKILRDYKARPDRLPAWFDSYADAKEYLKKQKTKFLIEDAQRRNGAPRTQLSLIEAVDVIVESRLAMTTTFDSLGRTGVRTLLVYNYDDQIYEFGTDTLNSYITVLCGSVSRSATETVVLSLTARADELAIYNPVHDWQIPVSNGVLDLITNKLIANTPLLTVTRRLDTPYDPYAQEPTFENGMTFDRLMNDLANNNPRRKRLLIQILKTMVVGHAPDATLIDIVGRGGDGKSLMMDLMTNVIGQRNVANINFNDFTDDNLLYLASAAWTIIGPDNIVKKLSKDLVGRAKQISSRDPITINRKYLPASTFRSNGVSIQLWNQPPNYGEASSAIFRRVVTFYAENSHYESGTQDNSLKNLINNKHWHKYILRFLIQAETAPYFTDYEDVDRGLLVDTLASDDPIGSFIESLVDNGVLSSKCPALHRGLLYAMYIDWMEKHQPGSRAMGSRSFGMTITNRLRERGYEAVDAHKITIQTYERTYGVKTSTFGSFSKGPAFLQAINDNARNGILERVRGADFKFVAREGRRDSKNCSVFEYFDILQFVLDDVRFNHDSYMDIIEEELTDYMIDGLDKASAIEVSTSDESDFVDFTIDAFDSFETPVFKDKAEKPDDRFDINQQSLSGDYEGPIDIVNMNINDMSRIDSSRFSEIPDALREVKDYQQSDILSICEFIDRVTDTLKSSDLATDMIIAQIDSGIHDDLPLRINSVIEIFEGLSTQGGESS